MKFNFLAFAVPVFISLILIEYFVSIRKNKTVFRFDESISNLNIGMSERLTDILTTGLFFYFFDWIHKHYSIFKFKEGMIAWVLLFLFTDLMFYWYHRFGHKINLLWSAHVVHHQSDDFNYTVSVRITLLQAAFRSLFWSFLPIIGFSAYMVTTMLIIHGAYPFFTHTRLIGKLGWLEYFLVTPSHHRVHHSRNPRYLDKNFGDVLIIWDKMFGTFQKEEETDPPVYGLTKPLNSHSFLWQHFHFVLELGYAFFQVRGIRQKFKVVFGKPDDIDPAIRTRLEQRFLTNKRKDVRKVLTEAITAQTILNLVLLFFVILLEPNMTGLQLGLSAFFMLISIINTGAMLEQKSWIFYLELGRLFILCFFLATFSIPIYFTLLFLALLLIATVFFRQLRSFYESFLYQNSYQ